MNRLYESFCVCLLLSMMLWQSVAAQPETSLESEKSLTPNTMLVPSYYQYGLVLYQDGSGIPGVYISDNFGDSTVSDSNGSFILNISSYPATVTPSIAGVIFIPASVTVDITTGDIIFTGYPASTNTIGGTIHDSVGAPLTNAEVRNSAGHTTYTDNTGYYQFSEPDGSYTITPTLLGYAFSPTYLSVSVPPDFTTANFTGTQVATYMISGHIHDTIGSPVSGVTVNLGAVVGSSNLKYTTTTNTTGAYTFTNLVPADYTISPALTNHSFNPTSLNITVPPDNTSADFTDMGMLTYTISGQIKDNFGDPMAGVSVSDGSNTALSNNNGVYAFTNLIGGTYTLTPTLYGHNFNPPTMTISVPLTSPIPDFIGQWTPVGIPFRPNPDGYHFDNNDWYTSTLYSYNYDFSVGDVWHLFGDRVCASIVGGVCTLTTTAQQWYDNSIIKALSVGHCEGISVTALRMYAGLEDPMNIEPGANVPYLLDLPNARRYVSYYQMLQATPAIHDEKNKALHIQSLSAVVAYLRDRFLSGTIDQFVAIMAHQTSNGVESHAVVPYALFENGKDNWNILVYDPDRPGVPGLYIDVNLANTTWSFQRENDDVWDQQNTTGELIIISMLDYVPDQTDPKNYPCPWCDPYILGNSPTGAAQWDVTQSNATGANVVYTDANGNQLGSVNGNFVSDIPGASTMYFTDGANNPDNLTYYLPITGTYTISLNGDTITQTQQASYIQFGQGYSFMLKSKLSPTTDDEMSISPDGKVVGLTANQAGSVNLTLTSEVITKESLGFHLNNLSVSAGEGITLTNNTTSQQLELDNNQGKDGQTYDLIIHRITAAGEQDFTHPQVSIGAGDTEHLSYGAWDGQGDITLSIDHGSDGSIDEVVHLGNMRSLFMPLVIH